MLPNQTPTPTVGRWFLLWTTIGCVFALQLHWYHELPWSLSIFWGIADWYLWGLLALASGAAIRRIKHSGLVVSARLALYLFSAPAVAALHVIFTMLVGEIGGLLLDSDWIDYFQALYAKKLTLNLLTCAAIVIVFERLTDEKPRKDRLFLTKLGDVSRLISADEIIWGEVCGNYVNLHTRDGVWPLRDTLTGLLDRLPRGQFIRISRSAMVGTTRIHEHCSNGHSLILALEDGTKIRVSRRYRPLVRQALRDHVLCDSHTRK